MPQTNKTSLTDLPPELLDHITTFLPTANSLANLSATSKQLQSFVGSAWQTFSHARFPSLCPQLSEDNKHHQDVARTLTTLSRAWDRRAFVARYIEPHGDIRAFPGNRRIDRWKRPRGQTIGFTPQLDCFEEVGDSWQQRREVLAFSAGAEVCVWDRRTGGSGDRVKWVTYRPLSASEGRDDVTSLHLLKPQGGRGGDEIGLELITGTANGDLQLLNLSSDRSEIPQTYFTTQGLPVRSSSVFQQQWQPQLLAANMGDSRVCLYPIDSTQPKIQPTSQVEIRPPTNGRRTYRAWSTNFLSSTHLAVGTGPSDEPIHVYALTASGLSKEPLRKFSLQNEQDRLSDEITLSGFAKKKASSSVYPIVPLPPYACHAGGSSDGQVFLSGAYDGIIRLHDLRSKRELEQAYVDPTDDSAIYSLLPRGQETLIAGTSRHSLLKVFDLRLGAKNYAYLDASSLPPKVNGNGSDWNLFLKPHSATYPGRGGGNNWARRSAESSIYSLTSPSPSNPHIYAGVENAVLELCFTSILDPHPDPTFFRSNLKKGAHGKDIFQGFRSKETLDLAMYSQDVGGDGTAMMKLMTQRSPWETTWTAQAVEKEGADGNSKTGEMFLKGLDERWKVVK